MHRTRDPGGTLRTAVDHAERERGVRRDLETGRAGDRLVLLQLSAAHHADADESKLLPGLVADLPDHDSLHCWYQSDPCGTHPSVVVVAETCGRSSRSRHRLAHVSADLYH